MRNNIEKLNSWNISYAVRNGDIKDYDDIVNEVLEYLRNISREG